jgi:dihydropteroate synthase
LTATRTRHHDPQAARAGRDGSEWTPPPLRLRNLTLDWSRTYVVGVLNVTPDSFSDGGRHADLEAAVAHGRALWQAGADLIDVGGESTRPHSTPVTADEELRRVIPVIERLRAEVPVPLSIDTYKAGVAAAALAAGADVVNDISGGRLDSNIFAAAGRAGAPVIVGHLRGQPATMQDAITFADLVTEVVAELRDAAARAEDAGAPAIVDPGLGFGKTAAHNLELVARLGEVRAACRHPLCIGPSRKAFLGVVTGAKVGERLYPSVAAAAICALNGADLVRVHDVAEAVAAIKVADAVRRGLPEGAGT